MVRANRLGQFTTHERSPMTTLRSVVDREDAFLAAVADMQPEYLICRTNQHRWPEVPQAFRVVDSKVEEHEYAHRGQTRYAKRELVCDRCGTVRHDYYEMTSRRGHTILRKLDARYEYPTGYATKGLGVVPDYRGLILGLALDEALNATPVRGRGRPKKGA